MKPPRTFTLDSPEFHAAVRAPMERPWIANGALPTDPPTPERRLVIEGSDGEVRHAGSQAAVRAAQR